MTSESTSVCTLSSPQHSTWHRSALDIFKWMSEKPANVDLDYYPLLFSSWPLCLKIRIFREFPGGPVLRIRPRLRPGNWDPVSHVCACLLSRFSSVWLFATLLTVAHQPPLSVGFSRQEYWSGLPCSPPGGLPNPGMELKSHMPPA